MCYICIGEKSNVNRMNSPRSGIIGDIVCVFEERVRVLGEPVGEERGDERGGGAGQRGRARPAPAAAHEHARPHRRPHRLRPRRVQSRRHVVIWEQTFKVRFTLFQYNRILTGLLNQLSVNATKRQ